VTDHLGWFRDARFGLFVHWGTYALRGFEASWPLVHGQISYQDYAALADRFNPQHYDPTAWAELAQTSQDALRRSDHQAPRWVRAL